MGFEEGKQAGTSHVHWRKTVNKKLHKVTVDCPKAPFSQDLITSMSSQAGVSKTVFYEYCLDKKKKNCPHGLDLGEQTA